MRNSTYIDPTPAFDRALGGLGYIAQMQNQRRADERESWDRLDQQRNEMYKLKLMDQEMSIQREQQLAENKRLEFDQFVRMTEVQSNNRLRDLQAIQIMMQTEKMNKQEQARTVLSPTIEAVINEPNKALAYSGLLDLTKNQQYADLAPEDRARVETFRNALGSLTGVSSTGEIMSLSSAVAGVRQNSDAGLKERSLTALLTMQNETGGFEAMDVSAFVDGDESMKILAEHNASLIFNAGRDRYRAGKMAESQLPMYEAQREHFLNLERASGNTEVNERDPTSMTSSAARSYFSGPEYASYLELKQAASGLEAVNFSGGDKLMARTTESLMGTLRNQQAAQMQQAVAAGASPEQRAQMSQAFAQNQGLLGQWLMALSVEAAKVEQAKKTQDPQAISEADAQFQQTYAKVAVGMRQLGLTPPMQKLLVDAGASKQAHAQVQAKRQTEANMAPGSEEFGVAYVAFNGAPTRLSVVKGVVERLSANPGITAAEALVLKSAKEGLQAARQEGIITYSEKPDGSIDLDTVKVPGISGYGRAKGYSLPETILEVGTSEAPPMHLAEAKEVVEYIRHGSAYDRNYKPVSMDKMMADAPGYSQGFGEFFKPDVDSWFRSNTNAKVGKLFGQNSKFKYSTDAPFARAVRGALLGALNTDANDAKSRIDWAKEVLDGWNETNSKLGSGTRFTFTDVFDSSEMSKLRQIYNKYGQAQGYDSMAALFGIRGVAPQSGSTAVVQPATPTPAAGF